jgi:tetratricopeptide (TPR) repeat protein
MPAAYVRPVNLLIPAIVALLLAVAARGRAAETSREPISSAVTGTNTEAQLKKIEAADDAAQAEVDKWLRENDAQKATGAGLAETDLRERIAKRLEPVRRSYEDFLKQNPENAKAHLLFGGFLNDHEDEQGAQAQWEKALQLDPGNAVIYNNLAGRYSESGPLNKAFEYFAKAIELSPSEPVYYRNFADGLYVRRKQAAGFYGITEQQVFAKILLMYSNALRLDPQNFAFARDLAQTYYSLKPFPVETALAAWTNAQHIARIEVDQEDACVHLARVKMLAGRFEEARSQLNTVTNEVWIKAKDTLLLNIAEREKPKP